MIVLMVPVSMAVFMNMGVSLMPVFMSVMAMGTSLVAMLVLMLVLALAAHLRLTSFFLPIL
jgi:hypothetical protein